MEKDLENKPKAVEEKDTGSVKILSQIHFIRQ